MPWIVIALILAVLFFFVKATNKGQNVWSYLVIVGVLLLLVTMVYASTFPGVSFSTFEGVISFLKVYFAWVGKLARNFVQVTGQVVKLDWSANLTAR